ncbi:MAG TPA: hypothetical protein VIE19_04620 [Lapillicoccus sp.]|jgi:hypothetical protein
MTVRLAVAMLVLAGTLSACGASAAPGAAPTSAPAGSVSGSTPTVSHTKGLPPAVTPTDTAGASLVGWSGPGLMYLVTYGSGSCPKLPTSVAVAQGNRLTIVTAPSSDGPCTMDFGPTTSAVDVPPGIDDTKPVEVTVDGVVSTVPPR